jgi:hypothetical protein
MQTLWPSGIFTKEQPMPRSETVLTVFAASPIDVAEERTILEEVIRELNITWSKTLCFRLDLVRWETNAYPGFGTDAQAVINEQIGCDYDIFIGVMWTRYGSPTKRAGSGTQEEFLRAYATYKEKQDLRLMLYFKDAPISPSKVDPDQLRAVTEFKKQLGEMGGLYWGFSTSEEFQSLLRMHLSRVVQDWHKTTTQSSAKQLLEPGQPEQQPRNQLAPAQDDDEEELGYLDYIDMANESFEKANETIGRISQYIENWGDKALQRTEEINKTTDVPSSARSSTLRAILEKSAEDMDDFVARTNIEIPIFHKSFEDGLTAYANAVNLSAQFGGESTLNMKQAHQTISSLRSSMIEARGSITAFRTSVGNLPRMISSLNRTKREALSTIDRLIRELMIGENLASEVEKAIREGLHDAGDA